MQWRHSISSKTNKQISNDSYQLSKIAKNNTANVHTHINAMHFVSLQSRNPLLSSICSHSIPTLILIADNIRSLPQTTYVHNHTTQTTPHMGTGYIHTSHHTVFKCKTKLKSNLNTLYNIDQKLFEISTLNIQTHTKH